MMNAVPTREFAVDKLNVCVFADRPAMGAAAAAQVSDRIHHVLAKQQQVRMVFAAAPSQNEVLAALCQDTSVDWSRVTAFHMDEYVGLPDRHPARFSVYLDEHVFNRVPFAAVHRIQPEQGTAEECQRYSRLLEQAPIDIVCLGIGENGHIAFNDPGVADFHDPLLVKSVSLDQACRMQQVHDGCFPDLDAVPATAITLTIPALLSARHLICSVPGPTKRKAVHDTLFGPMTEACPASILRTHADCTLFVDDEAYGEISDVNQ